MYSLLQLALESEEATGKAVREIEHVIYARVSNFDFLANAASSEIQEQWEIKIPKTDLNAGKGGLRVRKTYVRDTHTTPQYVLTCKTDGKEGKIEVSIPCLEDTFKQFKILSDRGMIKERFVFPVEGTNLKFEVDVFFKKGTSVDKKDYEAWVKIDLEVNDITTQVPNLPFLVEEIIDRSKGKLTDEQEGKISHLYDTLFLSDNVFLK